MSIGKVLGGTVIATPAVGGGGYVIYKEVTKEENTANKEASSGTKSVSDVGAPSTLPVVTSPGTGGTNTVTHTPTTGEGSDASRQSSTSGGASSSGASGSGGG